jgi:hypothetical protein
LCNRLLRDRGNERTFGLRIRPLCGEKPGVISGREMPFEALIFPGYLRVITKEIPKCKRLEFVVSTSHYEMHMMCVWPRFRFMEVRTNRVVLVRDMHVAKHGEWRDVAIKRV